MYKNILILGSNKSGKTTFARKISDTYGYSIINLDNIISTFEETFPKEENDDSYEMDISNFIINYIKRLCSDKNFYGGKKYVIEGNIQNVEHILSNIDHDEILVLGLTYENISNNQLLSDIRENDEKTDWTYYLSNEILAITVIDFLQKDKMLCN